MAIQQKLSPEQQAAYEAFKCAVNSLQRVTGSLNTIEEELGVELQVGDLTDMFDPEDDSVESFLGLLDEINKEG
jgi:hypothetical protein